MTTPPAPTPINPSAPPPRRIDMAERLERLAEHADWLQSNGAKGTRFVTGAGEDLSREYFFAANLRNAMLDDANLADATLQDATLTGCAANCASMPSAKMEKANLADASLMGADLHDALMWNTTLTRTKFSWARLSGAKLNGAKAVGASFAEAQLDGADLQAADLTEANLFKADLRGANLRRVNFAEAEFREADLRGAKGLFGMDRASGLGSVKDAEHAIYGNPNDFAHWAFLRFLGTLHLFSASNASFVLVLVYATALRWYNDGVSRLHDWAGTIKTAAPIPPPATLSHLADLASRAPRLEKDPHFALLLIALISLCVATGLFTFVCPDPVKEATETRWTRELNQPLAEYRSAMYHAPIVRYTVFAGLVLGGGYTLWYLAFRAYLALSYLLST